MTLKVHSATADADAIFAGKALVHAIMLVHADGTATMSVDLKDGLTAAGGTSKGLFKTNLADGTTFQQCALFTFPCPIRCDTGLSADLTGTGTFYIYYE